MIIHLLLSLLLPGACSSLYTDPHCEGKQVIVHLFMWKWTDIAIECERFLSKQGYCGVQLSPPNEHAVIFTGSERPWWDIYQPVSYKMSSRMGTDGEMKDMVARCNKVGVRIYADAVINHMAAVGTEGNGSAGTPFSGNTYDYPGVPYNETHFNARARCPSASGGMDDVTDVDNVRYCELLGLRDLDQSQQYVRDRITGYLNALIEIGVAGFRVDASKHIWPQDLSAILDNLKDVQMGGRPFFYHEVTDFGNEAVSADEYNELGYVTEFRYSEKLREAITANFNLLSQVVDSEFNMLNSGNALVFVDNHDTQRNDDVLTYKSAAEYQMSTAFMLAYDYGFTRVMSSYGFSTRDQGPPHYSDFTTRNVTVTEDGDCRDGWICEHRWAPITSMVPFRNTVSGTPIGNWVNTESFVAFSRGNKGFFVMSKKQKISRWFATGLPAGRYCNVINSDCETLVHVDGNGRAHIRIDNTEQPMVAVYVGGPQPDQSSTACEIQADILELPTKRVSYSRTIVLVEKRVAIDQQLSLMGGIDHGRKSGCTRDAMTSACAIPIRHRDIGSGPGFSRYSLLARGDNYLDWYGPEHGQGTYGDTPTRGSPMVWTTNEETRQGYYKLNTFGADYWAFDVDMDCSYTLGGWFEVKARVDAAWEPDIRSSQCTGRGGGGLPYSSNNHLARCGFLNVFRWDDSTCRIEQIRP